MDQDITINEGVEDSGESFVKDHGFAAIPIHFNPKQGAEKKFALVIPGIEPPLAFFRVSGDTPDDLSIEEIDGHVESVSQGQKGGDIEESVDTDTSDEEPPDSENNPGPTTDDFVDAMDEDESRKKSDSENTHNTHHDVEYPHEDSDGNPVAGFLLGNEENQPLVVVVKPQADEESSDAMSRVSDDHPEHIEGSLDEAIKLLGHSPLTSEDN